MALSSSSCGSMLLFVVSAVGAVGCVAFHSHSPRHLGACDMRKYHCFHFQQRRDSMMMMQCHYTKLNVVWDDHQEEGRVSSQHWHISIAAASFLLLGGASTANANAFDMDMPSSFAIIQQPPYKHSVQDAFQGFIPETSSTIKFRTMVSSVQSTSSTSTGASTNIEPVAKTIANTVKDVPKAMQQSIANPAVPQTKGPTTSAPGKTPPTPLQPKPQSISSDKTTSQKPQNALQTTGVKKIVDENKVEVELICNDCQRPLDVTPPVVRIDRETFSKVKIYQPPYLQYLPSSVQPLISRQFQSVKVLKSIPSEQLFLASVFAGSLTEMIRTCLLYPLSTVKARVQARTVRGSANRKRPMLRKLRVTWLTFLYETKRGDWYAGILPTILITVPASGVYSGAKEVSRRAFSMAIQFQVIQNLFPGDADASSYYSALVVNLLAAFVADVASLAIRTPADVLALRLQVFGDNNVKSDYTDWAKDSLALLPAMLLTDIPFLLSRIFLNAAITTSGENLGRYEFETIVIGELILYAFIVPLEKFMSFVILTRTLHVM